MTHDQPSGTGYIDGIRCGTHLCEFHNTDEELAETLVPYFSAGLQQDEFCLWVTSDPAGAEGAKIGLRKAAPYLDRYLDLGQIEIWDYRDWYLRGGYFDADRVFGRWVEKEKQALDAGYKYFALLAIQRGWRKRTGRTSWFMKPKSIESFRNIE